MRDPKNPTEWQNAVNVAKFSLALQDAAMYGLIEPIPGINDVRCVELLARGEVLGYTPNRSIEGMVQDYMRPNH